MSLRALRVAVVAWAAVAYAWNAPSWVLGGDNGEFVSLFAAGGIAHPPGFPTWVLWLRLCHAFMPSAASAAYGAALATVAVATLSVWALQRACLAWGAPPGASAVVSAVYAFSPVAWELGSHAEVFAMNALFAGVILAMCAPPRAGGRPRGIAWMVTLGCVAGLAIDAHQTIVLLAPVGLTAAVRAIQEAPTGQRLRLGLSGIVALMVAVVLPYGYVYALARANDFHHQPLWIDAPTVGALFAHFRRAAYGTFSLAPESLAAPREPIGSTARFLVSSSAHLLGLPLLLGALLAPRRSPVRAPLMAVLLSYLLAGPLFAATMNLTTQGAGLRVAERFELLPDVLVCLLAALALDRLAPRLLARPWIVVPATVTTALVAAFVALPAVHEARRPDVARYIDHVLETAPPQAIVIAEGDACWGGFMAARYAEGRRPDVTVVNPALVRYAWHRRDVEDATGVSFETPDGKPIGPKTSLARLAVQRGRPLFYVEWPDATLAGVAHDSYGPLMRVVGEDPRPSLDELLAANTALFTRYDLPPPPEDPTAWGRPLYEEYARAWVELGRRFEQAGREGDARACFGRAMRLAPWALTIDPPRAP